MTEVPEIARVSIRCLKTPGHTQDSISLVMLEGEKGVFTGDTVLGMGTTHFEDLGTYMTSLPTLLALKPNVLYPAHGPHIPNAAKAKAHLETNILHQQERENQICKILKDFKTSNKSLVDILVNLKKEICVTLEEENKAKGPLMLDKQKPIPLPDFKEEREAIEKADKEGTRNRAAMPLTVICRLIYKSEEEKLLFAGSKGVAAHLSKLEQENKVKKGKAKWGKLIAKELDANNLEEADVWEWAGEVGDKENKD